MGVAGSGRPTAGCAQVLEPYFISGDYCEGSQGDAFAPAREAFTHNLRRLTGLEDPRKSDSGPSEGMWRGINKALTHAADLCLWQLSMRRHAERAVVC